MKISFIVVALAAVFAIGAVDAQSPAPSQSSRAPASSSAPPTNSSSMPPGFVPGVPTPEGLGSGDSENTMLTTSGSMASGSKSPAATVTAGSKAPSAPISSGSKSSSATVSSGSKSSSATVTKAPTATPKASGSSELVAATCAAVVVSLTTAASLL